MVAQGSLVNGLAIIIGAVAGTAFGRRLDERYRRLALQGISLAVLLIGAKLALQVENVLVMISAVLIGAIIGEFINIEGHLESAGATLQRIFRAQESTFVSGFVSASLVFCIGSMAIVGSIEEGVRQDASILYAKALIDGATSVTFAATMGIGVSVAALPVLLYQGALTYGAALMAPILNESIVTALSATGGLLITAIGMNLLDLTKIRVGNLLPAIFVAGLLAAIFN